MSSRSKKIIFRWIKVFAFLYLFIGIALFFFQEMFLFHPVKLDRSYRYQFSFSFEEVDIPFNKTDTISMVKFYPADSVSRGVVIYLHGNKGNINRYAKFAANFTKHGYEVWMEDYPGFGKSTGTLNENKLYQQAKHIYSMAAVKFNKDQIVVFGKSFGTGIADYLASVKACKQLIL